MAGNQYLVSSSRAGLGSVVVTQDRAIIKAYLISNVGVMSTLTVAGAAQMDGVASVAAIGVARSLVAAQMDGQAQVLALSVLTAPGAAHMDGQAQVLANSLAMAMGSARMDGQAQVAVASVNMAMGAGQMDGRTAMVVAQSVPGAGLAEMDGAASMAAVAPHVYKINVFDTFIGGEDTSMLTCYKPVMLESFIGGEIIKTSSRYRLLVRDTINLTDTINYTMKFLKLIQEIVITLTPSLEPHSHYHYVFTTPIRVRPKPVPSWNAIIGLVEDLVIDQATSQKFIWGRTLKDILKISTAVGVSGQYKKTLAQLFKLIEAEGFVLRHPVALSQHIDLSLSLAGATSLKLLQKLLVATASSPRFNYHRTLTGRVIARDILEHLVSGILVELFTVHPAIDRQFIADSSLAQLLTVHPALNNKLVLKITGHLQLSPEQLVSMLYQGDPLLDGVTITALFISPSGVTTTWVVNTRTNAITEYLNYEFRSFASMGNKYIAAGAEGLYELDGDTDDGALIISNLMGGYLQLNEKKLFGIKGAYVAIRGGGRFYLKLISGDGREYVYELKAQPNLMTTKVKVGKGIKTTYMAFELVTEGQDFDLDSIEFIPMTSERRV
jgi:hypothetical protein